MSKVQANSSWKVFGDEAKRTWGKASGIRWIIGFFFLGIVAGVLGFGVLAGPLADVSVILFAVFGVLCLAALVTNALTPSTKPPA